MKKSIVLVFILIILNGCSNPPEITEFDYFNFDTSINVKVYDELDPEIASEIDEELEVLLTDLENKYSPSIEDSYINQANDRETTEVDEEFIAILSKSIEACNLSDNRYDPSSGSLIKLWSITNQNYLPTSEEIEVAKSQLGCDEITIDQNQITMPKGYILDFGSSVKGYAGDQIEILLKSFGIENALINLGGNIQAVGDKLGDPFQIAIMKPEIDNIFNENVAQMPLTDNAMITSGINQRFFTDGDKVYHHIIDATTGYPADNELASVTIIADSGLDADVLSTTVFLLGLDQGYKYIEDTPGVEAVFVTRDKKIYQTTDFGMVILDEEYTLSEYQG